MTRDRMMLRRADGDGAVADFPLGGLRFSPDLCDRLVVLAPPTHLTLEQLQISIRVDDCRPGGLTLPFIWALRSVTIVDFTQDEPSIWHTECGPECVLQCHNSIATHNLLPTHRGVAACWAAHATVQPAQPDAAPVVPALEIEFESAQTPQPLHLVARPRSDVSLQVMSAAATPITAGPVWLPSLGLEEVQYDQKSRDPASTRNISDKPDRWRDVKNTVDSVLFQKEPETVAEAADLITKGAAESTGMDNDVEPSTTSSATRMLVVGAHSLTAAPLQTSTVALTCNGYLHQYVLTAQLSRGQAMQRARAIPTAPAVWEGSDSARNDVGASITVRDSTSVEDGNSGSAGAAYNIWLRFAAARLCASIEAELGFMCVEESSADDRGGDKDQPAQATLMYWSERLILSAVPAYFAACGEYEFAVRVCDEALLEQQERRLAAVRLYVAADEWIVDRVGVVDAQSRDSFAAELVTFEATERDRREQDETLAEAVRVARQERRTAGLQLEVTKAAQREAEADVNAREVAVTAAQAVDRRVQKEVREVEAEIAAATEGQIRGRRRWKKASAHARKMSRQPRSRSPDPWDPEHNAAIRDAAIREDQAIEKRAEQSRRGRGIIRRNDADSTLSSERQEALARARWRSSCGCGDGEWAQRVRLPPPWLEPGVQELWEYEEQKLGRAGGRGGAQAGSKRAASHRPWVAAAQELLTDWQQCVDGSRLEELAQIIAKEAESAAIKLAADRGEDPATAMMPRRPRPTGLASSALAMQHVESLREAPPENMTESFLLANDSISAVETSKHADPPSWIRRVSQSRQQRESAFAEAERRERLTPEERAAEAQKTLVAETENEEARRLQTPVSDGRWWRQDFGDGEIKPGQSQELVEAFIRASESARSVARNKLHNAVMAHVTAARLCRTHHNTHRRLQQESNELVTAAQPETEAQTNMKADQLRKQLKASEAAQLQAEAKLAELEVKADKLLAAATSAGQQRSQIRAAEEKLKSLEKERAEVQAQLDRDKMAGKAKLETRSEEVLTRRLKEVDEALAQLRARDALVKQLTLANPHRAALLRECVESGLKAIAAIGSDGAGVLSADSAAESAQRETWQRSERELLVQQAERVLAELEVEQRTTSAFMASTWTKEQATIAASAMAALRTSIAELDSMLRLSSRPTEHDRIKARMKADFKSLLQAVEPSTSDNVSRVAQESASAGSATGPGAGWRVAYIAQAFLAAEEDALVRAGAFDEESAAQLKEQKREEAIQQGLVTLEQKKEEAAAALQEAEQEELRKKENACSAARGAESPVLYIVLSDMSELLDWAQLTLSSSADVARLETADVICLPLCSCVGRRQSVTQKEELVRGCNFFFRRTAPLRDWLFQRQGAFDT